MHSKIQTAATRAQTWTVRGLYGALLAVTILASGPVREAVAADGSGVFRIFGSGHLTCQRWLVDRQEGNASADQSEMWVAGYLTAYNQFVFRGQDISKHFDGEAMLNWLDNYCQKRPPNTLVMAAKELIQMLQRHQ